jgi:hypothetical protein
MAISWCIHDLFVTSVHSRDTGTSPNCQTGRSPGPEGLSHVTPGSQRVVVLSDSDSRWKWGASVARQIAAGHLLDAYFLRGRMTPTERQLAESVSSRT